MRYAVLAMFSSVGTFVATILQIYSVALLVWIISSWIPNLRRHRLMRQLGRVCEPLLRPFRRLIPATGGIDLSPIAALIALQLLIALVRSL